MSIRWGRVLLGAFLMEVVLIAIALPLFFGGMGRVLVYVIPPAAFLATYAVTVWLARGIHSKFVVHGVLIGVVGTLMYIGLTRGQPEPWQYWLAHGLKVVGGAAGGMVLTRRQGAGSTAASGG